MRSTDRRYAIENAMFPEADDQHEINQSGHRSVVDANDCSPVTKR
jgi:hypothetical protein